MNYETNNYLAYRNVCVYYSHIDNGHCVLIEGAPLVYILNNNCIHSFNIISNYMYTK